jgi:hypothetical protein
LQYEIPFGLSVEKQKKVGFQDGQVNPAKETLATSE